MICMNVIIASYMIGCMLDKDSNRVEMLHAIDIFVDFNKHSHYIPLKH